MLEIVAQQRKLLEHLALIRRELRTERREVFGHAPAARILGEKPAGAAGVLATAAPPGAIRPVRRIA